MTQRSGDDPIHERDARPAPRERCISPGYGFLWPGEGCWGNPLGKRPTGIAVEGDSKVKWCFIITEHPPHDEIRAGGTPVPWPGAMKQ